MEVFKAGLWTISGQISALSITVLSLVILGRMIEPTEFGIMALVIAVHTVLRPVFDPGLLPVYVKRSRVHKELRAVFLTVSLGTSVIGTILICTAAPFLSSIYQIESLTSLLRVSALSLVFSSLSIQPQAIAVRNKSFQQLTIAQVSSQCLGLLVGISLALLGYGVWALVMKGVAESATRLVLLAMFNGFKWQLRGLNSVRKYTLEMKAAATITISRIVLGISSASDKVVFAFFLDLVPLGAYSRSQQMSEIPNNNIQPAITTPALSFLARRTQMTKSEDYILLLWIIHVFVITPCLLFVTIGDDLLPLVMGRKWDEYGWILQLSGVYGAGFSFQGLVQTLNLDSNRSSDTTKLSICGLLLVLFPAVIVQILIDDFAMTFLVFALLTVSYWTYSLVKTAKATLDDAGPFSRNLTKVLLVSVAAIATAEYVKITFEPPSLAFAILTPSSVLILTSLLGVVVSSSQVRAIAESCIKKKA
ncbi:oligosaccharide flippase family protein [Sulfitobacter sp. 916]|uniref:oligosaccharide flippase family protein n=1 Tax=Sulfitobacter sp. 916 TaxID=3368559 RepID=UPI003744C6A7